MKIITTNFTHLACVIIPFKNLLPPTLVLIVSSQYFLLRSDTAFPLPVGWANIDRLSNLGQSVTLLGAKFAIGSAFINEKRFLAMMASLSFFFASIFDIWPSGLRFVKAFFGAIGGIGVAWLKLFITGRASFWFFLSNA